MRNLWLSALGELLELQQDAPTHFVPGSLTCARLDRIYIAAPSWILFASAGSASTIMHPRQTHEKGFSDHSAVVVSLSRREALPQTMRPIAKEVVLTTAFKDVHDHLFDELRLADMEPFPRLDTHKHVIRAAAQFARNQLTAVGEEGSVGHSLTLTSIARAIASNDVGLARLLCSKSACAARHLEVTQGNQVALRDRKSVV